MKGVRRMKPEAQRPVDWERLVTEHEHRLYRAALAILRDSQEAEDAVQDTFVTYLKKRPRLDSPEHEAAWLLRVTVNGCKSRLRSPWHRRRCELPETLPAPGPEEREEVEEIFSLSAKDRTVIHLFYYEGFSTGEIARITGEAEGTVRSRLSRARSRLRALMNEKEAP